MRKVHKKVCKILNYVEHLLILICAVTGCVSVSVFVSLVGISLRITSPAVEWKIYVITAGNKKYHTSVIKKKKRHDKFLY